jgi:signal transduction histidine kinase
MMRLPRNPARRPRLPRHTVRLRLTLVYGGLFLVSGAALLAITYALVAHATGPFFFKTNGLVGAVVGDPSTPSGRDRVSTRVDGNVAGALPNITPVQAQHLAQRQRAAELRQLLISSGIGLGGMAVISIALGWVVAGRVLRPLRTITTAVRDISATNLHERLALAGPDDELKELGDTFNALLARLDESFQAQRRFVANASHELRTPLARQRALGQVAIDDPDATPETLRAAHERVLAAGAQQERLIDALLTLARGQTGIDRHDRFDLADITDRVLTERRAEAKLRDVDVRSSIPSARASGDPRLVERLVANLVDNAIRHNVAHGHLSVATEARDGRAVLIVANTGPVIAASAVDQLFTPFRRLSADRTASGQGVGLGLSIVRAIADAHAATVATRARHAGGLQIEVTFPRCDAHAEPETASSLRARVAALTAPGC